MAQPCQNSPDAGEDFCKISQPNTNHQATSYSEILDYVCSRLVELGGLPSTSDFMTLSIDEAGLDSLELTELIMDVEDRFSVTIDDANLFGSSTIDNLASLILNSLAE